MLKCGICGKEFDLADYAAHVTECANKKQKAEEVQKKLEAEKESKRLKEAYDALNNIKRYGTLYEGLKNDFKEKYPDLYKANFPEDCSDDHKESNDYFYREVEVNDILNYLSELFK